MDFVELRSSRSRIGNVPGAKELHLICLKWSRLLLLSYLVMDIQPGEDRPHPAAPRGAEQPSAAGQDTEHRWGPQGGKPFGHSELDSYYRALRFRIIIIAEILRLKVSDELTFRDFNAIFIHKLSPGFINTSHVKSGFF